MYNAIEMSNLEHGKCVLAVDWGGKRLGIAISDEARILARPLNVILHTSRKRDAEEIIRVAEDNNTGLIIVGVTYDSTGELTPSGRSAQRLDMEIKTQTSIPTILYDEEESTKNAISNQIAMGTKRKNRKGHLDAYAAAIILQTYLDMGRVNE